MWLRYAISVTAEYRPIASPAHPRMGWAIEDLMDAVHEVVDALADDDMGHTDRCVEDNRDYIDAVYDAARGGES